MRERNYSLDLSCSELITLEVVLASQVRLCLQHVNSLRQEGFFDAADVWAEEAARYQGLVERVRNVLLFFERLISE